uniref:Kynureninase n=1 Tax=Phallusia mammillata TaxID=59560 RepID=A0A6F9DGC6_9ASCI|nr:kynureninase-like [Phallusia mammillata]
MFSDENYQSPKEVLESIALENNLDITSEDFQKHLDANDEISHLRDEFYFPNAATFPGVEGTDKECIYLLGNSLGLQPKCTVDEVTKVLDNWKINCNHSHVIGHLPAISCDEMVTEGMAQLIGAHEDEVVAMNGLSVNLHLLLVSFYRPTEKRNKVLIEAKAFPSDHYIVQSQIKQRGLDPEKCMMFLGKPQGKDNSKLEMSEFVETIEKFGDEIALVLLPGVQYYTGQVLNMQKITKLAQAKGCMVGFDLAHAIGNIEMNLHDWGVDFAAWCTYKYLNSGPGCMAGAFIHRKHNLNNFPKFSGWWSHNLDTRLEMSNMLDLTPGAKGYRVTNPPPLLAACINASLKVFQKTTIAKLTKKSFLLTGYLEYLLHHYFKKTEGSKVYIDIITPPVERGCQLSLKFSLPVTEIYDKLVKHGVSCDIREPDVIRVAPVPLYNNFRDVYRFVQVLCKVLPITDA